MPSATPIAPLDATASLDQLLDLVKNDMAAVNQLIIDMTGSDVAMIPEVAQHLISSGGKRLRPVLTIAAAKLCGYEGENHIRLAASVEFMHTATLLHDDVVDESDKRRGKPTARLVWGNQASVLVGDYLLGQAFRKMVEAGSMDALGVLSDAAAIIAEGEVMQLAAAKKMSTGAANHMAIIKAKTAALFAAAAEVGPIIAGQDDATRQALRTYGMSLGIAFQLVDDALDYAGNAASLGKNVGDDFREGKITLPVIIAYAKGDEAEQAFWRKVIEQENIEDGDLEKAIALIASHNAITETFKEAENHITAAIEALVPLPDNKWKNALVAAALFVTSRQS